MCLLYTKNISHSFEYKLFENINFSINRGETIAIVGISGSGKSSFLHILSSLLKPKQGEVFYKDNSLYKLKNNQLLNTRRDEFGIIFQNHYLFRGFSGFENLLISSFLSKKKINFDILKRLKIENVINQNVGSLSGGQQQRVSIARVLVKEPEIIFADEPTGNLDEITSFEVMNILNGYIKEQNKAMIMVTHNLKLANSCDRVYKLENFKLEEIK